MSHVYKKWSNDEINYLRNNYLGHGNIELAAYLSRSVQSVSMKINELKLNRGKKELISIQRKNNKMNALDIAAQESMRELQLSLEKFGITIPDSNEDDINSKKKSILIDTRKEHLTKEIKTIAIEIIELEDELKELNCQLEKLIGLLKEVA